MRAYIVSYIQQGSTVQNAMIVRLREPSTLTGEALERAHEIVKSEVGPCALMGIAPTAHDVLTEPEKVPQPEG